jgi:hypothetical protein
MTCKAINNAQYFLVLLFGLPGVLEINTSRLKSGKARESTRAFYERFCREVTEINKPAACRESLHRQFTMTSLPYAQL